MVVSRHISRPIRGLGSCSLIALALAAGGLPASPALANCTGSAPNFVCSGANTATQNVSGADAAVTTVAGFSVTTGSGNALQISGSGTLSYTDTNASTLSTAGNYGLSTQASGATGAVTINTNGNISGGTTGIYAQNSGGGAISIASAGDVTGGVATTGSYGINTTNAGTDLIINVQGNISAGFDGIVATNNGTGATRITTGGTVTGGSQYGIYAQTSAGSTGGLTISAAGVSGGGIGIIARNQGRGATTVTATGTVSGATYGIQANNSATTATDLTVNVAGVTATTTGISASNSGTGATRVTATGDVAGPGAGGYGINVTNAGTDLVIDARGKVSGGADGILATNRGTGATNVSAAGTVSGANGIYADTATSTTGGLTVGAADVSGGGGMGIFARNQGAGAASITATGTVGGTTYGVQASNTAATASDLTVNAAGVTASTGTAINANNAGTGATRVTATGSVTGGAASSSTYGINATTAGTDLVIDARGNVSAGFDGIVTSNTGTGLTSVTTASGTAVNGGSGYGINVTAAASATKDVTIDAGSDVTGGVTGIIAVNHGSGNLDIHAGGAVKGNAQYGIRALSDGAGSVTVTADRNVTSGSYAIYASTANNAPIAITANAVTQTFAGNPTDLVLFASGGSTTITNNGTLTGRVEVSGTGTNTLTNTGDWNTAGDGTNNSESGLTSVTNTGSIFFRQNSGTDIFAAPISGSGMVFKDGAGTTILTGNSSYTGDTTVAAGALYVNGNQGAAASATDVRTGATLGGTGTIGGNVAVAAGGTLAPGAIDAPGTLTINGNLALDAGSVLAYRFGQPNTVGGPLNDLTIVHGNLTLGGTINVTASPGGSFDPGVYRIISYDGTLTGDDGSLTIGSIPETGYSVQTSVAGQVNLVYGASVVPLTYWDGADGALHANAAVDGGSGTWHVAGTDDNWTRQDGTVNAAWDNGGFAVFAGSAGTVTVDNGPGAVEASGMQFARDGYIIQGDDLTLTPGRAIIRVGDGTSDGAGYGATIAANLVGVAELVKSDLGTLTLTGTNGYTGGTAVEGGTLALGPATTTSTTSLGAGAVDIAAAGTLSAATNGAFTFANALTGTGRLAASNGGAAFAFDAGVGSAFAGTVALSGNSFALGGTNTAALTNATLLVGSGNVTTVADGNQHIGGLAIDGGTMIFNATAPAQTVATSLITTGTLDVSGTGAVRVNVPVSLIPAIVPAGEPSPFINTHVRTGLQLVAATGTVRGSAGALTLENQNGAVISSPQNVDIHQGGNTVAVGTWDYALGTGSADDGLYVGYALTVIDIQPGQQLTLTENLGAIGNDADVAARITGSGDLVIAANSVVSLSNTDNDFTGATAVRSGTLQANAADIINFSRAVTLDAGASFDLNGYDQSVNNLNGAGGSRILLSGATLTLNGGDSANSFAGALTGAGSLVQASGTMTLTGDSSGFSGPTALDGGALEVAGSLAGSPVTVGAGATLSGTGTVGGIVARSGATIVPGSSGAIGTLNVAGNVVFNAGSVFQIALDPATASRIVATGTATINGGAVRVLAGSGDYALSRTYTILTAAGGRTGAFDGVTTNLAFLTPTLTDDANNVYLTMTRNDIGFSDVATTPNHKAAASATESLGPGNPVYDAASQLDEQGARDAFARLSGEVHASLRTVLVEDGRFVRDGALDRLRAVGCDSAGGTTRDRVTQRPLDSGCEGDLHAVWGRAFGSWGRGAADSNAARLDRSTGGFFMGLDGEVFAGWRIGALGGYSRTSFDARDRSASGASDTYSLGVYAGRQWGDLALRIGATYAWHDITTQRSVRFTGFDESLSGGYHGRTVQVFGELGYALRAGAVTFEPFAGIAYADLRTTALTERGGDAALTAGAASMGTAFSTLGQRLSADFAVGGVVVTAQGSAAWRHAFGDTLPITSLAYASGSDAFSVAGTPVARDIVAVDAGLDLAVSRRASFGVSYTGQFGSGVADNGVRGSFRLRF